VSDDEVQAALARGDVDAAATLALREYGAEVFGFLRAVARDDDVAADAFAQLGEDVWRGLPAFRWETALRAWIYTLGRHAVYRVLREERRFVSLSAAPDIVAHARTLTAEYRKTGAKEALRAIRDELEPDDHELLLLRIDRKMSWKDIARVLGGDANVTSRAMALRKRYERLKDKLRDAL
jgi:RNA polymerase sigma-70 factor, ECF subfamily